MRSDHLVVALVTWLGAPALVWGQVAEPSFLPPQPPDARPCAEVVDTFDDGEIDLRITYEYGTGGRVVAGRHDVADDGSIERIDWYRYGHDGLLGEIATDLGADGTVDERVTYTYEAGWLVREAGDGDADGRPESVFELEYDEGHRLVGEVRRSVGAPPERARFTYDEQGQLAEEAVDIDGDGVVDQVISYRYEAAGLESVAEDLDGDGDADWRIRYLYGPNDRLVTEEWTSDDLDTLRGRTTFRYDTLGRLVEVSFDSEDDGLVDVRTIYRWDCWDEPPVVTDP